MPDTWTAGTQRLTGDVITANEWNELLGADGSLNFLGTTHDHDGDEGDGGIIAHLKTVWLPVSGGSSIPLATSYPWWVMLDAAVGFVMMTWRVPAWFVSVSSIVILIHSGGTGNLYRSIEANSSVAGEDTSAFANVDGIASVAVVAGQLTELTVTVGNLPIMAAGDYFTLKLTRQGSDMNDTVNANVYALGAKLVAA